MSVKVTKSCESYLCHEFQPSWGQFHQTNGAKCCNWAGSQTLVPVKFHQQKFAQLYLYAWLENMLNSRLYAVRQ